MGWATRILFVSLQSTSEIHVLVFTCGQDLRCCSALLRHLCETMAALRHFGPRHHVCRVGRKRNHNLLSKKDTLKVADTRDELEQSLQNTTRKGEI